MDLSKIRILLSNKKLVFLGIAFSLLTMVLVTIFANKDIMIKVDDKEIAYSFKGKQTVGEVLEEQNLNLKEEDKVEPSLGTILKDGDRINIIRAIPVTVTADKREYTFLSTETEVQKILKELGISIGDLDIVEPNMNSRINLEDKQIKIIRVEEKFETDTVVLKHKDVIKKNSKMDIGTSEVVQRGSNGRKTIKEKVTFYDGVEAQREVIEETVLKKPVDQVKEVGTNTLIATSRGNMDFTKTIYVEVTGYCSDSRCVGIGNGSRTASGTVPTVNRTMAASSNFSFGTKFYIPGFKNSGSGGIYVVEDRGGAITGNKIDIYFKTHEEAVKFGRKTMKAYVLQ